MKNAIINIGLLIGSTLLFFSGIESVLRATGLEKGRPVPPPLFQTNPNPDISYELKPNMRERAYRSTIKTNSLGFRSPELDPTKPTMAVLGDSIAFGYGLENDETITAQLSTLFEETFNILNTAVLGYTLLQETATYEQKIKPLHPKALLLFFHFNDLRDMEPAELHPDGNIRPRGTPQESLQCRPITDGILQYIPGKCWLDLHSAFYRAVKKVVSRQQEFRNLKEQESTYRVTGFVDAVTEEQLQTYSHTLRHLTSSLPKNLHRLFVIWPEKELHLIARPKLEVIAASQGFSVLDLYEVFGNSPQTLSWDTIHPSANTAKQAAAIIKAALEHHGITNTEPVVSR